MNELGRAPGSDSGADFPPAGPAGATRQVEAELLDPGSQALANALRRLFAVLRLVMICVLGLFIWSGAYKVQQNEQAIELRFGRLKGALATAIQKPGWHWAWPYPVEEVIKIDMAERPLDIDSFWYFQTEKEKMGLVPGRPGATLKFLRDGYSLTASESAAQIRTDSTTGAGASQERRIEAPLTDYNLVHTQWRIRYRVWDALAFVEKLWDGTDKGRKSVEKLLRSLLADAVITISANRDIDWIVFHNPAQFSTDVQELVAEKLEQMDVGIRAMLDFVDKTPPRQVQAAFDRAAQAKIRSKQLKTAAQARENELISSARAEADIIIADAEAYRTKIVQAAASEEKYLDEVLTKIDLAAQERVSQEKSPDWATRRDEVCRELLAVTVDELYQEMLRDVIGSAEEVFVLNAGQGKPVEWRPMLSRDAGLTKQPADAAKQSP